MTGPGAACVGLHSAFPQAQRAHQHDALWTTEIVCGGLPSVSHPRGITLVVLWVHACVGVCLGWQAGPPLPEPTQHSTADPLRVPQELGRSSSYTR